LLALGCAACLSLDFGPDPNEVERSPARAIEEFCDKERYELEGSAKRTEGITRGTCAFSVGPSEGVVTFVVSEAVLSPYANYWFEVLLVDEDGENGRWKTVAGDSDTTTVGTGYSVPAKIGVTTRIIDVRLYAERTDPGTGCSIPRRAR
jgi:hypothetical protein